MAYSQGSTPPPLPPAAGGTAPINQITNGFGGRQSGNPFTSMRNATTGGNRTNQHVVTGGNNNVAYGSQLGAANAQWQERANYQQQTGIAPANGMSFGFMKNIQERPAAPVTPAPVKPPAVKPPVKGPATKKPIASNQHLRQSAQGWKVGNYVSSQDGDKYKILGMHQITTPQGQSIRVPLVHRPGGGMMIHPAWQELAHPRPMRATIQAPTTNTVRPNIV